MKLVIPIFHSEFDALQVSSKMIGEIPTYGDFGNFWWLLWLSFLARILFLNSMIFHFGEPMGRKMAQIDFLTNAVFW